MFVSFANRMNSRIADELEISFMYNKNNNGPNIEPCGTPVVIVHIENKILL
jgi:hypothetical protein